MKPTPFILLVSIVAFSNCNYLPEIKDEDLEEFTAGTQDFVEMLNDRGSDNLLSFYPGSIADSIASNKKSSHRSKKSKKRLKTSKKDHSVNLKKPKKKVKYIEIDETLVNNDIKYDTSLVSSIQSIGRVITISFLENTNSIQNVIIEMSIDLDTTQTITEYDQRFSSIFKSDGIDNRG